MKIISIVGTRPQFIKMAPLSRALRRKHREIIVHTGQHFDREMSDSFFFELEIPVPDYSLGIQGGTHGEQTGRMLTELERVLINEKPALVIIFGDTNSTLAGALAAAKLHVPVAHVEAGLRSFNRSMPEEINRIVADQLSTILFCPTATAVENLQKEGFPLQLGTDTRQMMFNVGDIMVDSHHMALEKSKKREIFKKLNVKQNRYYLLTLHRPYNVDNPENLSSIFKELGKLDQEVIFPVHPRTRKTIEQNSINFPDNFIIIKPVGYLDFVSLQAGCHKIITDSGGIQKEAYILKKPCITLRPETEWVETVSAGWNLLINPSQEKDYAQKIQAFIPPQPYESIFGENVAEKMVEIINNFVK